MKKAIALLAIAAVCLVSSQAFGAYANLWTEHSLPDAVLPGSTLNFNLAMDAFPLNPGDYLPEPWTGPVPNYQGFILYGSIEKYVDDLEGSGSPGWQRQYDWTETVYDYTAAAGDTQLGTIDHTGFDDAGVQFQLQWSDIHPDLWNFYAGHVGPLPGHPGELWPEHPAIPGNYDPMVEALGKQVDSDWVHFEKRINEQSLIAYTVYPSSVTRPGGIPSGETPANPDYAGNIAAYEYVVTSAAEPGLYRFSVEDQWEWYGTEYNTKSTLSTGSETGYSPMGKMQFTSFPPPPGWKVSEFLEMGQYIGPGRPWAYGPPPLYELTFYPDVFDYTTGEFTVVPEPTTMVLLGVGLMGLAGLRRRK